MVLYRAAEQRYSVIDFGMRAPASLDPADYPLTGEGISSDLFPWSRVQDDRNVHGPLAIAVPGVVDGMRVAHERFATLPWRELVEPAIELAEAGLLIDWFAVEGIASAAADLARYPASRDAYLVNGLPPVPAWSARTEVRLGQQRLAQTLRRLAAAGPRDLYEGELAGAIAGDVQAAGGKLSRADLASYRAREVEPLMIGYRDARVAATPELTAGPTLARTLRSLQEQLVPGARPAAPAYAAYARCLQEAYAYRLTRMGDVEGGRAPGCTSHFCVVDKRGNMAAVTQTLLSIFGSRFVLPSTGILMNNGIMWFDTEPGKPNSLGPRQTLPDQLLPGDRRARCAAFCAGGIGRPPDPARGRPAALVPDRFRSGPRCGISFAAHRCERGRAGDRRRAVARGYPRCACSAFPYVRMRRQTLPLKFACPSGVLRSGSSNWGATESRLTLGGCGSGAARSTCMTIASRRFTLTPALSHQGRGSCEHPLYPRA